MKPLRFIITIVVLSYTAPLFAQFDFPSMSGQSAGMGGVTTSLTDNTAYLANPAILALTEQHTIVLSTRQSFLVEGLGYAAVGVSTPLGKGGASLSVIHYGNNDYNEQEATLSYALPLAKKIALGSALHYLHSATSDPYYEPLQRFTFTLALLYQPSNKLTIGFKAFNPIAVVSDKHDGVRTPALFNLGAAYWILDELMASFEVEKNLYYKPCLRVGLQYTLEKQYFFRTGFSTQPVIYTFGAGALWNHLGIDLAMQVHSILGITPQITLHCRF